MIEDQSIATHLAAGMPILYGGNRVTRVSPEIAARFEAGDRILVVQDSGDLLHIPEHEQKIVAESVTRALEAFHSMAAIDDASITGFYTAFAERLADDRVWADVAEANAEDVERARARGRSTTRLAATPRMRTAMVDGLREWRDAAPIRGRVVETISHQGWTVEQVMAPLGVVGFVFEGRPNVFADATGVLRGGNTVVFRIGSDALGTARAIMTHALKPALSAAGLPDGAVVLLQSAEHAAGWALFADSRLSLAVARGSGRSVAQLGSVARQSGVPVSLHGTGGAWLVADESADPIRLGAAIVRSLDRKVCNTLNVCALPRRRTDLIDVFRVAVERAGEPNNRGVKLHVVSGDEAAVPARWFSETLTVRRAGGPSVEPVAETLEVAELGREWEWEETPEITVKLVDSLEESVLLFNHHSPQFIATLVADDSDVQKRFFEAVNAPFVGNGFTRWPDGQYALSRPELGLSNWQSGRLFARGAILSGDGIYTIRTRATQTDPDVHR
ncbi:MAG: aldehyde dehydrogenase family protein [Capsulimonadaceae bacterium]